MSKILLNISDLNTDNLIIAFVGYIIVFSALVLLFFVFKNLSNLIAWQTKIGLKKKGKLNEKVKEEISIPGAVGAAISTALYLYLNELHDEEKTVLTIKKISKTYSPWSSKIYGMRWPLK